MKLTLGKTVTASLVFAGVVLVLMTAGALASIHGLATSATWVAHTQKVMERLHAIQAAVVDLETAERAYILNGQEEYVAPYEVTVPQIQAQLAELRDLVADNAVQTERAGKLTPLVERKIALTLQLIAMRRQGRITELAGLVRQSGAELKTSMDQIRDLTGEMLTEEARLLAGRQTKNDALAQQSYAAAGLTVVAGLLGLGGAGWVIHRELRARQQVERELARSRGQVQSILDNAPVCIYLKDLQGRFTVMNRPFKDWFGMDPQAALGKTVFDYFPKDKAENFQRNDDKVFREGQMQVMEETAPHVDGTEHTYLSMKVPLRDADGRIYALCGISSDITERKRMEVAVREARDAAEAASRTKSQFLANMSHELRTPLNSIIGFSEILGDQLFGTLNGKQTAYVGNILQSGRHLLLLINDLLDLAKIEAGRLVLDVEPVDPARFIADGVTLVKGMAERKGVVLEVTAAGPEWPARLDAARSKQVIYNLLSNAIKFTPAGGKVGVRLEGVHNPPGPPHNARPAGNAPGAPLPGNWLRLTVEDSGIGIAAEDLERIFGEFVQVDSTYARQQEGTGLGLALTRKLIELHGGWVWAESAGATNQGSRFVALWPQAAPRGEAIPGAVPLSAALAHAGPTNGTGNGRAPQAAAAEPAQNHGGPLILVVEDDEQARALLTEYLQAAGYAVAHAARGDEALRLAAKLRPAAITLDILLPDANGMDVLARLKAHKETAAIPVVIVSVTDDRELGMSLGAVEFFVKPVRQDRLLEVLARARAATHRTVQRVLVVDDAPADRETIKAALRPEGYHIVEASSGAEALELATAHRPDLAIVDLTMPGMSGFELVNRLRESPATQDLPIFIYTARDLSTAEIRWLHARAAAITPKPLREQLVTELKNLHLKG